MNIINKNDLLKYIEEIPNVSFSIDRFEENFAVCENRLTEEMLLISLDLLPQNSKSGDILIIKNNSLFIDIESTQRELEDIKNLVNKLFNKK